MKEVAFPVNHQNINGRLYYPEEIKPQSPGVIFLHGWATGQANYIKRARGITDKGAICLTFDFRGHGKSDGRLQDFSREDHLEDAISAFDFLTAQQEVDKEKIGVCGMSYGGYLAAILASQRVFPWLVLRSPALYKDANFPTPTATIIEQDSQTFSQYQEQTTNNMALRSLVNYNGDVLLIEAGKDEEVPHRTTENYLEVLKNKTLTHKIIKGADHQLSSEQSKQELIDIIAEWFSEKFKQNFI